MQFSGLPENWQWPEPVKLLAADGKTDIYGLVFRPSYFCSDQSYPVIAHGFNTPEICNVSKGAFSNGKTSGFSYYDAAALAELGFIVVQIDGRGTPLRAKSFQDDSYGSFQSASNIDDHVAGIRQLAKEYSYMDIDRVGISAASQGGSGAVEGMLRHSSFFKVGAGIALHDRRFTSAAKMGNKYEDLSGPLSTHKYPEQLVENLEGKLLMMHGMLDWATAPAGVFRLIEALHAENKDFDLVLLPNVGHAVNEYFIRRSWDYFVRYLLQADPPKEFNLKITA